MYPVLVSSLFSGTKICTGKR